MTDDIAIQSRCIHCLTEHDPPTAIVSISYGETPCHRCGKYSRPMTWTDYVEALSKARERQAAREQQIPRPRFRME